MAPPSCKGLEELKNEVYLGNSDRLVTLYLWEMTESKSSSTRRC